MTTRTNPRLREDEAFTLALDSFAKAGTREWLESMIARVSPAAFCLCRPDLWQRLFKAFGSAPFGTVIDSLIDEGAKNHRGLLFTLLEVARHAPDESALARRLLSQLVRITPKAPRRNWEPQGDPVPPGDSEEARALLLASPLLSSVKERELALDFLRADRSLEYVRAILGPLLLEKGVIAGSKRKGSVYPELLTFAIDSLGAEISRDLKPYPDWTRPCPPPEKPQPVPHWSLDRGTTSGLLDALARFMADPSEKTHDFKRSQHDRSRVEEFIKANLLDLDRTTIKVGTPHTLRLTKNDSSYQHALAVRKKDEALLAKLRVLA